MGEQSVHEAAVAAMAGALCEATGHAFVIQFGRACPRCVGVARKQNAALVASAEVREGLVAEVASHACPPSEECIDGRVARVKVGTVLAALAGTEAS